MCEFCDEEIAEWYCLQCALGMCERHREEGHRRLYPISGGHQLLELSGHKEGQERRRREKEEADRREQASRQQEDEMRLAKRKQPMRTDSAALSPFAALQSVPISAAEEALRAEIEQNLQHIAEQRNVEEALMAAKKADGRTSAGSGQGSGRSGARKLRVLDTPSITHRFVPLITKQDVVDNWSRLMDDVAHLYPKPKPKRSGRRTRTPASGLSDMTASSLSAVLPPQHESNSVQLGHILPIASRLGGRSVSAVSPSQRRSAIARISCTPSPPLSPLRWKQEDDENERRRKQQADMEAQHARLAEDWRHLQQRARATAEELNGYQRNNNDDGNRHSRHYSLAHNDRSEVDDSPRSSTSSSRSASMRRSRSSIHLPNEQQLLFTKLPPPPPAELVRSQSSPPRQLEAPDQPQSAQPQRQRGQQLSHSDDGDDDDSQALSHVSEQQQEEDDEEVQEVIEQMDEDDEQAVDGSEFLPAPPALQKQHVVPSHRAELDFSADETFHGDEEEEEEAEETEESELRSVESSSYDDSQQQPRSEDVGEDEELYSEEYDDHDALLTPPSSFGDVQLVAEWRRANEHRQHSDPLHSEYVHQPQYRNSATQTDEQRMTHADSQRHDAEEQEEGTDEYMLDDADGATVQLTPLRAGHMDGQVNERTPLASSLPIAEYEIDELSDIDDDEQQLDDLDDEEQQPDEGSQEGSEEAAEEEEAEADIDDSGVGDGSLMRDEPYDSEYSAEPLSQTSLSPLRSPASSFEWHDQDLNDAMWMKSSTDSKQQRSSAQRRAQEDALQLLPSPFQAAVEPPFVSLPQPENGAAALSVSRVDQDVLLLAHALQRILTKRDGRPSVYPPLPSFSRLSQLHRPAQSTSTAASASVHSTRHRRRASDMSSASSFSRVPLPPHAYPRSSPPVYPVSLHSHSQRLAQSSYIGQQRAEQQPAASTSSSSQSSSSHQRRERQHSSSGSSHRSRHRESLHADHTARSLLQPPPAAAPAHPSRSSSRTAQSDSRHSSRSSSSLSLDLSHGALRRLDRVLVSHMTDKLPTAAHSRAAFDGVDGTPVSDRSGRNGGAAAGAGSVDPRIVQSSASAITVQLKAAQSLSILASMERHNSRSTQLHHHTDQHKSMDGASHSQRQQQHKRTGRSEKREAVSLASRAYQAMRVGEQHGSRRAAWNE